MLCRPLLKLPEPADWLDGLLTGAGVSKQLLEVVAEGQLVAGDQEAGPKEEGSP